LISDDGGTEFRIALPEATVQSTDVHVGATG